MYGHNGGPIWSENAVQIYTSCGAPTFTNISIVTENNQEKLYLEWTANSDSYGYGINNQIRYYKIYESNTTTFDSEGSFASVQVTQ